MKTLRPAIVTEFVILTAVLVLAAPRWDLCSTLESRDRGMSTLALSVDPADLAGASILRDGQPTRTGLSLSPYELLDDLLEDEEWDDDWKESSHDGAANSVHGRACAVKDLPILLARSLDHSVEAQHDSLSVHPALLLRLRC